MKLSVRYQDKPEPAVEGNRFLAEQLMARHAVYTIVLDGDQPVAQQSFYFRGARWWVDDLHVAPAYRGTEVIALLREATFRALAERTHEFRAWIQYGVAKPETILADPIKQRLGVKITVVARRRSAALYHYDISSLRPLEAAAG